MRYGVFYVIFKQCKDVYKSTFILWKKVWQKTSIIEFHKKYHEWRWYSQNRDIICDLHTLMKRYDMFMWCFMDTKGNKFKLDLETHRCGPYKDGNIKLKISSWS